MATASVLVACSLQLCLITSTKLSDEISSTWKSVNFSFDARDLPLWRSPKNKDNFTRTESFSSFSTVFGLRKTWRKVREKHDADVAHWTAFDFWNVGELRRCNENRFFLQHRVRGNRKSRNFRRKRSTSCFAFNAFCFDAAKPWRSSTLRLWLWS